MAEGVVKGKAVARSLPNPTLRAGVTLVLGALATLGAKWLDALLDPEKPFGVTGAVVVAAVGIAGAASFAVWIKTKDDRNALVAERQRSALENDERLRILEAVIEQPRNLLLNALWIISDTLVRLRVLPTEQRLSAFGSYRSAVLDAVTLAATLSSKDKTSVRAVLFEATGSADEPFYRAETRGRPLSWTPEPRGAWVTAATALLMKSDGAATFPPENGDCAADMALSGLDPGDVWMRIPVRGHDFSYGMLAVDVWNQRGFETSHRYGVLALSKLLGLGFDLVRDGVVHVEAPVKEMPVTDELLSASSTEPGPGTMILRGQTLLDFLAQQSVPLIVRLTDFNIRKGLRWANDSKIRIDALVTFGESTESGLVIRYRASTVTFTARADGESWSVGELLLFVGTVDEILELALFVSPDRSEVPNLAEMLYAAISAHPHLSRDDDGDIVARVAGRSPQDVLAALEALTKFSSQTFASLRARLDVQGLYRGNFIRSNGLGIGRHPESGFLTAGDFSFAYTIDRDATVPASGG